jgi:hypothetical protein
MLDQLLAKLTEENKKFGFAVDGYDNEYYITRNCAQYTVYVREEEEGFYLGTYKDMDNEDDTANNRIVKGIKAVENYINKFI